MQSGKGQIYLLVGFFGSGKTTFIRSLLQNRQGEKYAIIQNEFAEGEMGIERGLITDESGTPFSNFLELPNGCICCSAKTDLVAGIEYILEKTEVRKIIVETNGMAEPGQSIKQFWFDERISIGAQLHSVIAVISARKWLQIKDLPLLERQIIYANRVLITFLDSSPATLVETIVDRIRMLNPQCYIAKNGEIEHSTFLKENSLFDLSSLKLTMPEHFEHSHEKIRPIFLKGKCLSKSPQDFQKLVGILLWESAQKILRIKGVICIQEVNTVFQLQGVDDLFELKLTNTPKSLYENETRILVIGQGLKKVELEECLQMSKIV